jgi:hypothetical protein
MFSTPCTNRMQTPGSFSTRLSATELSATPPPSLRKTVAPKNRRSEKPSLRKEEQADRSQTDPSTDFHPEIGMKQPVLPGQGEARNILIGAVNRQVASH